jgi:hypothetical protein
VVRDYFNVLLRCTGRILWGPFERFITIGGGLVGILVVFNESLLNQAVSTYQGIPQWIGFLVLGILLLQAIFRASYMLWKNERQARKKAEGQLWEALDKLASLKPKDEWESAVKTPIIGKTYRNEPVEPSFTEESSRSTFRIIR